MTQLERVPHPSYFARETPDKAALIMAEDGAAITYKELADRSARLGNLFVELGVAEGDTIAILLENHIRYAEIVWAAKDCGLIYVAVSSHLNAADAAYVIDDCGAKLLISSQAMAAIVREAVEALDPSVHLLMLDGAEAPFSSYEDMMESQPSIPVEGRRRGASMLYSSGTTGRPKGVRTEIADVPPSTPPQRFAITVPQYGFDSSTVFINPGPFYHAGPLRFMMTVHRCGGTVIGFCRFDAPAVLAAIETNQATHGFFVPTMFSRMLKLKPEVRAAVDISSMRHAIHAASPCPPDVKRAMIGWWGLVIDELYSGTEAVGHTFISSEEWLAHPGSVGRPARNCRIKIIDEHGVELPPGSPGRIMMSNGLPVRYHGKASTVPLYNNDGFASLGDIGYLDKDGYLYLTDRESYMIIVGGVNIYPQEAESILCQHPGVVDVAVIGVPHADRGEEVKAVVQPVAMPEDSRALETELLEFCRERLSHIKCPRSIDFVESLPRNEIGKLLKRVVKDRYWQNLDRHI